MAVLSRRAGGWSCRLPGAWAPLHSDGHHLSKAAQQGREGTPNSPGCGWAIHGLARSRDQAQSRGGALIVQHLSVKGPVREWWTEDDLIASAPVPLPVSLALAAPPDEAYQNSVLEYSRACMNRYVDIETGIARMTAVPVPFSRRLAPAYVVVHLGGGLMTAMILPTGRKLAGLYPQGKVVTLITWDDSFLPLPPLLAIGDAEAVFLHASTDPTRAVPNV